MRHLGISQIPKCVEPGTAERTHNWFYVKEEARDGRSGPPEPGYGIKKNSPNKNSGTNLPEKGKNASVLIAWGWLLKVPT